MSVVHPTWSERASAVWRTLTWAPEQAPLGLALGRGPVPRVREGVVDLFAERARESGARVTRVRSDRYDPSSLPDDLRVDAVVDHATLGVATAGAVVLTGERARAEAHGSSAPATTQRVCVLPVSRLVFGVPEAVAMLDARRSHTWVRGAAADPDLELDRIALVRDELDLRVLLVG